MSEALFSELIGKRVLVIWNDRAARECDWISFVMECCVMNGWVMRGVASPDGIPHDGTQVVILQNEVRDIIEWKEGA